MATKTYNPQPYYQKQELQIYNFFTSKVVGSTTQNSSNLEYVNPLNIVWNRSILITSRISTIPFNTISIYFATNPISGL